MVLDGNKESDKLKFPGILNKVIKIVLFSLCINYPSFAQQIKGFVVDPINQDTLAKVTIFNHSKNLSTLSDQQGYFQIIAQEGDTIFFLQNGYYPKQMSVRRHHFWDNLYISLPRHTILLTNNQLMQEHWHQILKKFRKPIAIAGLPPSEYKKIVKARSAITIISESDLKADIKDAYQLNDDQLEQLIIMFHEQQRNLLVDKDDGEIISFFLQYVEAKIQQRP